MKVTEIWTAFSANWVILSWLPHIQHEDKLPCTEHLYSRQSSFLQPWGSCTVQPCQHTWQKVCYDTQPFFLSLLQTYLLNFLTLHQCVTFYPNYKLMCILQHMLQLQFSRLCLHLLRQELHRFWYFVPRVGDRVWLWGAGECRKMCVEDKKLWSGWKLSGCWVWLYMTRGELQLHSPWLLQNLHLAASMPGDPEGTYYTSTDSRWCSWMI